MIRAFEREQVDVIAVNAAGCGSNLKDYGVLLADDPLYAERARRFSAKCKDVTVMLAGLEAARRASSGAVCALPITTPAICSTPWAFARSRGNCSPAFPNWRCRRSPKPPSAAARRAFTTWCNPGTAGRTGRAQGAQHCRHQA